MNKTFTNTAHKGLVKANRWWSCLGVLLWLQENEFDHVQFLAVADVPLSLVYPVVQAGKQMTQAR